MVRHLAFSTLALTAIALFAFACSDDDSGEPPAGGTAEDSDESAPDGSDTPPTVGADAPATSDCTPSDQQYAQAPKLTIDQSKTYIATIVTAKGNIVLELYSDVPVTTNNFVFLAREGYYDCVTFHRVIPGFVAQGGDPTGTGSGGPGYEIDDEDDGEHRLVTGVISMAKSGPNTTGSQFFITYAPQPNLDADFTAFGEVIEGMDVLAQITPRDPSVDPNAPPGDIIETITIEER